MAAELRIDDAAPWKQRFRAPVVLWTTIARNAPTAGLAVSNRSGAYQLYAWDVPTGDLTPLTDRPEGIVFGILSPDGRFVYYLDDQQGNEIGHFVRVPFAGVPPLDLTPDLPPYSAFGSTESRTGNLLCTTLADAAGFHVYTIARDATDRPRPPQEIYHRPSYTSPPVLSYGGELAVVASTERTGKPQYTLVALDTAAGEPLAELWDGGASSHE